MITEKTMELQESDEDLMCTQEQISDQPKQGHLDLLPKKSRDKYDIQYKLFMDWCSSEKIIKYSENVILSYLSELSQKYKSSTIWSIYSMLKTSLMAKQNINIGEYLKVKAFLKQLSVSHVPKKSKVFNSEQIYKFLTTAPDDIYLMAKVVLIVGISGACRTEELTNMTLDNLVDHNDILIIRLPNTKTHTDRTFTVCNSEKENSVDVVGICRKYFNLRPKNMTSRRLFFKLSEGKSFAQNVGHHTMGAMPSRIASYLNLPNTKEYTGHSFRRTSTTLLADPGDWRCSNLDKSIKNKMSVTRKVLFTETKSFTTSKENNLQIESMSSNVEYHLSSLQKNDTVSGPSSSQDVFSSLSNQGLFCKVHRLKKNTVPSINLPPINNEICEKEPIKIKEEYDEMSDVNEKFNLPSTSHEMYENQIKTEETIIKTEVDEMLVNEEFNLPSTSREMYESEIKTEEITIKTEYDEMQDVDEKMKEGCNIGQQARINEEHLYCKPHEIESIFLDFSQNVNFEKEETNFVDVGLQVNMFCFDLSNLLNTDKNLKIFTGIPNISLLNELVEELAKLQQTKSILNYKNLILLTLTRLKQDLRFSPLSVFFNINSKLAKIYFQNTVHNLALILKNINKKFLIQNEIRDIPPCFDYFPNTRMLLSCVQKRIKQHKNVRCKGRRFSFKKNKSVVRFLIGMTPSGLITYVSKFYTEKTPFRAIFFKENVISRLSPGDAIMVNRGFIIDKKCSEHNITVYRPPFIKKTRQFAIPKSTKTIQIAKARMCIKKNIRKLAMFRILRNVFPCTMVPYIRDIVTVITTLTNLSGPNLSSH